MSLTLVGQHLHDTADTIRGALNPFVWQGIAAFYEAQKNAGYDGPVAEIGVHHGKFFISLLKIASTKRPSVAFDIFDLQSANVDKSGKGDLEILRSNILESGLKLEDIKFVRGDSLLLSQTEIGEILKDSGRFAFFSVDGGHTIEHTINDLRIAMALTSAEGVIFLDDYYNPNWPGAQEGLVRLFTLDTPTFVPILYMSNKLFLCHFSKHEKYLSEVGPYMRSNFPGCRIKMVSRVGYRGFSVTPDATQADPRKWFSVTD